MIEKLKAFLLFFYGTSQPAVTRHTSQARMIAYTLGGIIAFVTLPFVFAGTVFLVYSSLPRQVLGVGYWYAVIGISMAVTLSIVWVERALVILGDAVAPHWLSQLVLLLVRLAMISLFSMIIASKWEKASHQGLIRDEIQVMHDEAIERHKQLSNREFDVSGLSQQEQSLQQRINELQGQLATLPPALAEAQTRVQDCQVEAKRLWAEYTGLGHVASPSEAQTERMATLKSLAPVKAAECAQHARNVRQGIADYKRPIQTELDQKTQTYKSNTTALGKAETHAKASYDNRIKEANLALTESGTDDKAFARVRQKNPDIDLAVKQKTLLLAAIEMLPLLLKLLLWNSPISSETRAILQSHSAHYRTILRQSAAHERLNTWTARTPMAPLAGAVLSASPYVCPAAPMTRSPNIPPEDLTKDSYWVGYANQ